MREFRINAVAMHQNRKGFSLLELLVVMAVIAVIVAITLPAAQLARESARKTQCRNNLHQIAVGVSNFESTHGRLPANGWGFRWMGDPNRGVGKTQPGGWVYQLLPFMDQKNLATLGKGSTGPELQSALAILSVSPVSTFRCPSRPSESVSDQTTVFEYANMHRTDVAAKTDYAICEGDYITDTPGGPASLEQGDDQAYAWTDVTDATGVSFLRHGVRLAEITDGLSNTYLVGEKNVSITGYKIAADLGYDQSMYCGVDLDISRWTIEPPISDRTGNIPRRFGSAHADGCFLSFCDGSVRFVSFTVDQDVHRAAGNRHDGSH